MLDYTSSLAAPSPQPSPRFAGERGFFGATCPPRGLLALTRRGRPKAGGSGSCQPTSQGSIVDARRSQPTSPRSVLVTGASSGFGLGIARVLASRGWRVFATVRDLQRVPLERGRHRVVAPRPGAGPEQIRALASDVTHRVEGRLDCLVNNAGFGLLGPLASYSDAQMRRQMEVNFFGPAILTRELLPALIAARGRVVNLSSMLGETGMPLNALYCASKHALEGLSRALRHELAPRDLQVAIVAPGGFRTRFGDNVQWGERNVSDDPVEHAADCRPRARGWRRACDRVPGADAQRVVQAGVELAQRGGCRR